MPLYRYGNRTMTKQHSTRFDIVISFCLPRQLDLFGLQLRQGERMFTLSALGLFKLDKHLLFSLVQTIIIYITILIQFDKIINT